MRAIAIIIAYIIISILLNIVSYLTKSTFLDKFFDDNIINVIITVFAINMATATIVVGTLGEIAERKKIDFSKAYTEIKFSFLVQILLAVVSLILLILKKSTSIEMCHSEMWCPFFNTALTVILCAMLHILWDTGSAIFEVVEHNK